MQEVLLAVNKKIRIAVNHYDSSEREAVVIICPGCFMCKDSRPFVELSDDLYHHYDVITVDFRGHGKSSGSFTFTAREHNDLRTVVAYARKRYARIGLMGFSLGAGTALIYTGNHRDVESLIAVSAPADFSKIENHFLKPEALVPALKMFQFEKFITIRPGNIFLKKIKPVEIVEQIAPIPLLFLTGNDDPIIHSWHARELFKKAGNPRALYTFYEGFHAEGLYLESKEEFVRLCVEWFDRTL